MVDSRSRSGAGESASGGSRAVRRIYAALAWITWLCVIVQFFLAGLGTFAGSENWELHVTFVNYFEFLPVAMFLLSFFGRIRGGLRWIGLGLYALITFQHMSVEVFSGIGAIAALHTVVALALFAGSWYAARRSRMWLLPGRTADAETGTTISQG